MNWFMGRLSDVWFSCRDHLGGHYSDDVGEKMKIKSYRQTLDNNQYLDITVTPRKWTTLISMSLWEVGNGRSLSFNDKIYLNYDKFLPRKTANRIAKYKLNKQSRKVAKFDLIN